MPVRFEINDGLLQVRQSFDFPAVYLDHWAVALLSRDADLGAHFLRALRVSGGSLVVSILNFAEITGGSDSRNAEQAAMFFESILPNIYFAEFDLEKAIAQEAKRPDMRVRLAAPADIELLREVGNQRPDDFQPFTIANVVRVVAAHRDEMSDLWLATTQAISDRINEVRTNSETVRKAKGFKDHPANVPTLAVMQELIRTAFLDRRLTIDRNDAADFLHAILSIVYCDYTLLDGKWEDLHARMVRRFKQLGFPLRVARVFSDRRDGVQQFFAALEGTRAPDN